MRYSTELIMRRTLDGKPEGDYVLESLGFTWGPATCVILSLCFTFACFLGGWAVLLWKTREFSTSRMQKLLPCIRR